MMCATFARLVWKEVACSSKCRPHWDDFRNNRKNILVGRDEELRLSWKLQQVAKQGQEQNHWSELVLEQGQ